MGLDADTPEPPTLVEGEAIDDDRRIDSGADVRRNDLESMLADGAWVQGFEEWVAHTDLDESEWEAVTDLELIEEFDFFWDGSEGRVGYSSPGIPPNWRQQELHPHLDSWSTVSSVNAALSELGATVAKVLTQEYVDWDTPDDPDADPGR